MGKNTEYAIYKGKGYILIHDEDSDRIVDEYGCTVIKDAKNGWCDLLDYIVEAERCSRM